MRSVGGKKGWIRKKDETFHPYRKGSGGTRLYDTPEARQQALDSMLKDGKFNYFVKFLDVNGYGLQIGTADWVPAGRVHIIY
jgi:hypothetical protein